MVPSREVTTPWWVGEGRKEAVRAAGSDPHCELVQLAYYSNAIFQLTKAYVAKCLIWSIMLHYLLCMYASDPIWYPICWKRPYWLGRAFVLAVQDHTS